jgi:sialidase-1
MKILSHLFLFLFSAGLCAQSKPQFLFKNYRDGYPMFRIPTLVISKTGKIFAFCEGRKNLLDNGDIDLVMKTSEDQGKTWSNVQVIWNDGKNTCGNPAPVYDQISGDIIIVATMNNDRIFVLRSKDEGKHWEKPVEITASVKPDNWKWYACGPVHAIQLQLEPFKNRLIVPCNHTVTGKDKHVSHIIFSDDSGNKWQLGGSVTAEDTDECTAAELSDGKILLNMRNSERRLPNRKISYSNDGGISWSSPQYDSAHIEPVCQAALLRYSFAPDILLFSNPKHHKQRKNLVLSISHDSGKNWSEEMTIYRKKAAYSDLVQLPKGHLLCIFETGKILPYGGIVYSLISRESYHQKIGQ